MALLSIPLSGSAGEAEHKVLVLLFSFLVRCRSTHIQVEALALSRGVSARHLAVNSSSVGAYLRFEERAATYLEVAGLFGAVTREDAGAALPEIPWHLHPRDLLLEDLAARLACHIHHIQVLSPGIIETILPLQK